MYLIEFHEDINKDFKELGHSTKQLIYKKLRKLAQNPIVGDDLGNKANLDLSGLKKVYVDNKRIRIVYKIIENKIKIFVVAVGKRDDMAVYRKASQRISN